MISMSRYKIRKVFQTVLVNNEEKLELEEGQII